MQPTYRITLISSADELLEFMNISAAELSKSSFGVKKILFGVWKNSIGGGVPNQFIWGIFQFASK